MTRRFGGTGLGLTLSRRLAQALGGDVTVVKNGVGVGTTFRILIESQADKRTADLAFSEPKARDWAEAKERSLNGLKILVVDDAIDNQQLIWRYLTKHTICARPATENRSSL